MIRNGKKTPPELYFTSATKAREFFLHFKKERKKPYISGSLVCSRSEITARCTSEREAGWRKILFQGPIWVFCFLTSLPLWAGSHNNDCVYVKEIQSIACASGKGMNDYGNTKCLFMAKGNMWKQRTYERKQSSVLSLKKSNVISRRTIRKIWRTTGWSASRQSLSRWWSNSFWKAFPNTWRTRRWLEAVKVDLPSGSHA